LAAVIPAIGVPPPIPVLIAPLLKIATAPNPAGIGGALGIKAAVAGTIIFGLVLVGAAHRPIVVHQRRVALGLFRGDVPQANAIYRKENR